MKKRLIFNIGITLFSLGFIFLLNSLHRITGFVISDSIPEESGSFIGSILILVGLVFLILSARHSSLDSFVQSPTFVRHTRKVPPALISGALRKIGSGLGHEHVLNGSYQGKFAVRASKSGRIIYHREGERIILDDYLPSHNY